MEIHLLLFVLTENTAFPFMLYPVSYINGEPFYVACMPHDPMDMFYNRESRRVSTKQLFLLKFRKWIYLLKKRITGNAY